MRSLSAAGREKAFHFLSRETFALIRIYELQWAENIGRNNSDRLLFIIHHHDSTEALLSPLFHSYWGKMIISMIQI